MVAIDNLKYTSILVGVEDINDKYDRIQWEGVIFYSLLHSYGTRVWLQYSTWDHIDHTSELLRLGIRSAFSCSRVHTRGRSIKSSIIIRCYRFLSRNRYHSTACHRHEMCLRRWTFFLPHAISKSQHFRSASKIFKVLELWLSTGKQQASHYQWETHKTNQIDKDDILYVYNHKSYHLRETVAVINPL